MGLHNILVPIRSPFRVSCVKEVTTYTVTPGPVTTTPTLERRITKPRSIEHAADHTRLAEYPIVRRLKLDMRSSLGILRYFEHVLSIKAFENRHRHSKLMRDKT